MKKVFEDNTISIPKDHSLPNTNCLLPFCLVGDKRFPLKTYLMRPFAKRNLQNNDQRIFNYRLSRARRVIENTFGILVSRWRILYKPLALKLSTVEKIIQAVTCLHNYIITTNLANNQYLHEGSVDQEDADETIIPGNWHNVVGENSFINPFAIVEKRDHYSRTYLKIYYYQYRRVEDRGVSFLPVVSRSTYALRLYATLFFASRGHVICGCRVDASGRRQKK